MIGISNFQSLKIFLKGGVTASPFGRKIVQTLVTSYITQSNKTVLGEKPSMNVCMGCPVTLS